MFHLSPIYHSIWGIIKRAGTARATDSIIKSDQGDTGASILALDAIKKKRCPKYVPDFVPSNFDKCEFSDHNVYYSFSIWWQGHLRMVISRFGILGIEDRESKRACELCLLGGWPWKCGLGVGIHRRGACGLDASGFDLSSAPWSWGFGLCADRHNRDMAPIGAISLCRTAIPFKQSKTGIFAQKARVYQAVGLYYRKEILTFQ